MKKLMLLAVAASLLVATIVYAESALQPPTYEASAVLLVGQKEPSDGKIHLIPNAPSPEDLRGLTQTMARDIDSRPVAEGAISPTRLSGRWQGGTCLPSMMPVGLSSQVKVPAADLALVGARGSRGARLC